MFMGKTDATSLHRFAQSDHPPWSGDTGTLGSRDDNHNTESTQQALLTYPLRAILLTSKDSPLRCRPVLKWKRLARLVTERGAKSKGAKMALVQEFLLSDCGFDSRRLPPSRPMKINNKPGQDNEVFNLITSAWLPVRDHQGQPHLISLLDLFRAPTGWADLDVRPHERVSVMRLLVCITQAALGAPEDTDGWADFGQDFSKETTAYLAQWQPAFSLLAEGPRFLQRRPTKEGEPVMISKLVPHLATGNNPTNFDHGGGSERPMEPGALALALLTFQNFYPLYGAGYKGRGPCVDGNMLHALLRGANLQEIILNNCLDAETIADSLGGMGRPLWEKWPATPADKPAVDNARLTYLGRLVPLHRTLWICDDRAHVMVGQDGWEYPAFEEYQEPSATVITTAKGESRQLCASLDRAIWRDLHALTVLGTSANSKAGAPLIIKSHQNPTDPKPADLWTGALVTDGKAKILDAVESVFHLESRLFTDVGRGIYELGVAYAQIRLNHLRDAVRAYGKAMMHESPAIPAAERHYWHALDRGSGVLMNMACDPVAGELKFGRVSRDNWTQVINRSLRDAYWHACPRGTAKEKRAFALGEVELNGPASSAPHKRSKRQPSINVQNQ
jgi:CRISPR system Cascade subunit CasA